MRYDFHMKYCAWCGDYFETSDEEERHCTFDCAESERREIMDIGPQTPPDGELAPDPQDPAPDAPDAT
jgi:hypothetical protein